MEAKDEARSLGKEEKKRRKERKDKKKRKQRDEEEKDQVENEDVANTIATVSSREAEKNMGQKATDEGDHSSDQLLTDDGPARKRQKVSARRLERKRLMEQIPKTDEQGIAYTKQQLRRMCKRVARGLDPVESEAEKQQRLKDDADLRRQEQAEFAGVAHDDDENDDNESIPVEEDDVSDRDGNEANSIITNQNEPSTVPKQQQITKKHPRNKPVPPDYVCSACQNKHTEPHWIYDCPDKVTVRGTNQKSKKSKGIHNPDSRKVFVSGLPFDFKDKDVQAVFASCGKLLHCKLLKFPDTGRCKGQAYVTFQNEQAAKKALEMSGSVIENTASEKKEQLDSSKRRQELKLKVTKALNRIVTKRTK